MLSEKELENKIKRDFFSHKEFDTTRDFDNIDMCISYQANNLFQSIHFLWAEAKKDNKADRTWAKTTNK